MELSETLLIKARLYACTSYRLHHAIATFYLCFLVHRASLWAGNHLQKRGLLHGVVCIRIVPSPQCTHHHTMSIWSLCYQEILRLNVKKSIYEAVYIVSVYLYRKQVRWESWAVAGAPCLSLSTAATLPLTSQFPVYLSRYFQAILSSSSNLC